MGNRKVLLGAAGGLVAVAVLGVFAVWFFLLRSDAPEEVNLEDAVASLSTPTAKASTTAQASNSPAASATAGGGSSATPGLAGTWAPDTSKTNFLGYRVVEELARVGTTTAVGRTSAVTGSVVLTETEVKSAKITADLTQLKSDNNMRDGQLRNQAIETSKFPTATFELSGAMPLPAGLAAGQAVDVTLKGKLTLHGVTKEVSVPAQAQLKDGSLVVVGSIDIKFADYDIEKPRGASVLSIEDHGIMELQLVLSKS